MQEDLDIYKALEILDLPRFITKKDIKKRYIELAKKYHPDITGDNEAMEKIITSYKLLNEYIENFRYSFDEDEISKQLPNLTHNSKFKL